jgi:hypothetical protein
MTLAELVAWVALASSTASHGAKTLGAKYVDAIAQAAQADPIDGNEQLAAGYLVALAWFENGNDGTRIGDHGSSFCFGQIYLPNGARTREGWTGPELVADPAKCATVTLRMVKQSIAAGPHTHGLELVFYARGGQWAHKCVHGAVEEECNPGETPIAVSLSKHRVELVDKLLREVKP